MGAWMVSKRAEEWDHGMKIFNYLGDRGAAVNLKAIKLPKAGWKSASSVFKDALAHERGVTTMINELVDHAAKEKDHASSVFLQWFVTEQVEEEAEVGGILDRLNLVGDAPGALFMIDRELGELASAAVKE